MKKSEVFALLTGVIGLAADAVTLCVFFSQRTIGGLGPSPASNIMIPGVMIYGWFIISWMLIRRAWVKFRFKSTRDTVLSTGLLLLPLQFLFFAILLPLSHPIFQSGPEKTDHIAWVMGIFMFSAVSLGFIGVCIYLAIDALMPVIYEDM